MRVDHPIVEDLFAGLVSNFTEGISWEGAQNPAARIRKPGLYFANHQTAIESLLFQFLLSGMTELPVVAVAKAEHRHSWINSLSREVGLGDSEKGANLVLYFERDRQESFLALLNEAAEKLEQGRCSLLIHVEGTRSLVCRQPVERVTNVLIDLAIRVNVPIIPTRFRGGLPVESTGQRLEFPWEFAAQHIHLGEPLGPDVLKPLGYAERPRLVRERINGLGPPLENEEPNPPNPALADHVRANREFLADPVAAAFLAVLERLPNPSPETEAFLSITRHWREQKLPLESSQRIAGFLKWLFQVKAKH